MSGDSDEQRLMTAYLLGTLAEKDRAEVGERALTDGSFFERLREVEEDLIDSLARGELDSKQAELVRRFLIETDQLDRLHTAEALLRPRRPGFKMRNVWLLAAGLAMAIGAGWWYRSGAAFRSRPEDAKPAGIASVARPDSVLSVFLPAGVLRGERRVETVPRGTTLVRIELEVNPPAEMTLWRVELRNGTAPPFVQSAPFQSGPVEVIVPGRALTPGQYEATLSVSRDGATWDVAGYYYFTVR